nr:hypothetical protein [Candidatus Sigynarchaeota archaeon]
MKGNIARIKEPIHAYMCYALPGKREGKKGERNMSIRVARDLPVKVGLEHDVVLAQEPGE